MGRADDEIQTSEFYPYFNIQATAIAPHDTVDIIYFSVLFANIGVHIYDMYQLLKSPYKEDNRAKPIILYVHVTTIILCLTPLFYVERTHVPNDLEVGTPASIIWGRFVLHNDHIIYTIVFFVNFYLFESHMLILLVINIVSLYAKARNAIEFDVIPLYNWIILALGILLPAGITTLYYWQTEKKLLAGWQGLQIYEPLGAFLGWICVAYAVLKLLNQPLNIREKKWELVAWDAFALVLAALFSHALTSPFIVPGTPSDDYPKHCMLLPIYSNVVLFAVHRFGDE
ncbi:unnamed protein product, partial [Mesorhabditis spiculigera]